MLNWFRKLPDYARAGRLEWLRAAVGALLGILVTGLVSRLWLGSSEGLPFLIAPMGASAVLLFAIPASPLAQPWSILGGNTLSALVGIAAAMLAPDPVVAAALGVSLAIATMSLCRCLHPPGGAVALTSVIGGPAVLAAGWSFALIPVALNSAILLGMAIVFNNSTRHRYPHRPQPASANTHGTQDPSPQDRVGFTVKDITEALARHDELLDVSPEDLDLLFRQVEARAHGRQHGALRCDQIMSRDIITALPEEGVGQARDRLLAHNLATMPVVDEQGYLLGQVGHVELLPHAGLHVRNAMVRTPLKARPETPINELLPGLSSGLHHEALITDAHGKLLGMITQTDLIAALWRRA